MDKRKISFVVLTIVVGLFLSSFVLYTPVPNTEDYSVFNTKQATEYIAEIAREPHSVFDEENHENVRQYLVQQLGEFIGEENVYEMDYHRDHFEDDLEYDVKNIFGKIEGNSDTAILIVGHYDSRGHIGRVGELGNSYGAADDGYAVATMLEIARIFGTQHLQNSLYFLFTDAEETGLYGAKAASLDYQIMDNVSLVINIEARGVKGPVYMFETSDNNNKLIDFYQNAELPVSYSLATAVYTVMPNSTDFTEFLDKGKNGLNFAVLNGLYYYHTPLDKFDNINQSSIEHYGSQIVPLVDEFVNNSFYEDIDYFEGTHDKIFFNVFKDKLVTYPEVVGVIIHYIILAALLIIGIVFTYQGVFTMKRVFQSSLIVLGSLEFAILVGYVAARITAYYSKVPFNLTYIRSEFGGIVSVIVIMCIIILCGYLYLFKVRVNKKVVFFLGTLLNALLAFGTGYVLSGASFLFMIPALFGVVIMMSELWINSKIIRTILYMGIMIVTIVVIVPLVYSLYLALTVGGLLALGAIVVFYLFLLLPNVYCLYRVS